MAGSPWSDIWHANTQTAKIILEKSNIGIYEFHWILSIHYCPFYYLIFALVGIVSKMAHVSIVLDVKNPCSWKTVLKVSFEDIPERVCSHMSNMGLVVYCLATGIYFDDICG